MKILKTTTYRGLVADQKNVVTLADKYKRLEAEFKSATAENERFKREVSHLVDEVVALNKTLAKYKRNRGYGGRFVKK